MNNVRFQHGVSFALRIEVFPVICSLWESERFSSSLKPHMEGNLHSPDKSWLPVIPLQPVPNRAPKLKDSGLLIVAVSESAEKHNPSLCFCFFFFQTWSLKSTFFSHNFYFFCLGPVSYSSHNAVIDRVLTAHPFTKDVGLKHFS